SVLREARIENSSALEFDLFRECPTEPHDDAAFYLRAQVGRVLDRPAFEGLADGKHANVAVVDFDFHTRGRVRAFFSAAGQPDASPSSRIALAAAPIEFCCGGNEHVAQTALWQVLKAEGQGI